jgi:glutaminyl-peptide cyclotransferase
MGRRWQMVSLLLSLLVVATLVSLLWRTSAPTADLTPAVVAGTATPDRAAISNRPATTATAATVITNSSAALNPLSLAPPGDTAADPATGSASAVSASPLALPAAESAWGEAVALPDSSPVLYTYEVINVYPHDPEAFTQGLVFDGEMLYEGTGLNGRSSLRRVELSSGQVLQQVDLAAEYFGEGITVWDERIIQLTWQSRRGFVYDKTTFERLGEFSYATEGWGITHDGRRLIMSDGSATLYFWNPDTFTPVDSVDVYDISGPVMRLNELEYIDGEVWANIWQTDRIARIDPVTGQVLGWVDLSGLLTPEERAGTDVLNGIAYMPESDRLFVTGKLWPKLFEIRVIPAS